MTPFRKLDSIAAALPQANIDTDQIIPARFLRSTRDVDHAQFLFHDMRRGPDGAPKPDFPLNLAENKGAEILIADTNFGCGSSRESAVYALWDAGLRCIIAPGFGDIFYNNSLKNGLLPVALDRAEVERIRATLKTANSARIAVDLESQTLHLPDGSTINFEIDPFKKQCLLQGLDDVDLTLRYEDAIEAHDARERAGRPWTRILPDQSETR